MPNSTPGLRDLLRIAADAPTTIPPVEEVRAAAVRGQRRRRMSATVSVAVVLIAAVTGSLVLLTGSPPRSVSAAAGGGLHTTGFVTESDITAGHGALRLQAPAGIVQWTITSHCAEHDHFLPPREGAGGARANCPTGHPRLSVPDRGSSGGDRSVLSYLGGQVHATGPVTVRVTLADGKSTNIQPQHALWLAIAQRCGNINGTAFTSVELIEHGRVIARKTIPSDPRLIARQTSQVCSGQSRSLHIIPSRTLRRALHKIPQITPPTSTSATG